MSYQYRAVEKFWRNFYRLSAAQKQSVRRAWETFKKDPFDPALGSHEIHRCWASLGMAFSLSTGVSMIQVVDGWEVEYS